MQIKYTFYKQIVEDLWANVQLMNPQIICLKTPALD